MKKEDIIKQVRLAIAEDIGDGDITAQLIPEGQLASAEIFARESFVLCGVEWVNQVFLALDETVSVHWEAKEGDEVEEKGVFCRLKGPVRALLSGERCALNFLQTLSATATITRQFVNAIGGAHTCLLDTRKTIPGLRHAQKYAVRCGGGHNHRMGLYDAFLIKENHIAACGSIARSVERARSLYPGKPIEIEVENFEELEEAIATKVDVVMLDNFSVSELRQAVQVTAGRVKLEASGNVGDENLMDVAASGVDYISVGALTKHIRAVDLSMRILSD